jgi:uncharacterized protein YbaP (TraB family)
MIRVWWFLSATFISFVFAALFLPVKAEAPAQPALWVVHGERGTAYLFGSIHILPPNVAWRAPLIEKAIHDSNVFVFEIPNDAATQARMAKLVSEQGQLPPGGSLSAMLSAEGRADYEADLALAHVAPSELEGKRPWLADLFLVVRRMAEENASPGQGVDATLMREAANNHKELRYLETIDTQIALIVPSDPKLELEEFESDLKEFRNERYEFGSLLAAWTKGDTSAIDALINGEFSRHPEARKALLDDRNRAWARRLEAWLREDRVFFVTVGAGHLGGRNNLVQLLRDDGLRVEGP